MKKFFIPAILILSHFFAGNAFSQSKSQTPNNNRNEPATESTHSMQTMDYNSRVFNDCTSEWIDLKGKVTYSIKEMISDNKYFILYQINLNQIEGIGEKTGSVYKGGGVIMDKVNAFNRNGNTEGNDTYKVHYKSPTSTLTITEKAHYVFANGEVKVSFNDSSDSCK